ncbi:MAG: hypothetical protein FWE06_06030 [Oscillospiraceae bacterium]|nr:hypothetical protein [Oscillospiraceae bacterium]
MKKYVKYGVIATSLLVVVISLHSLIAGTYMLFRVEQSLVVMLWSLLWGCDYWRKRNDGKSNRIYPYIWFGMALLWLMTLLSGLGLY